MAKRKKKKTRNERPPPMGKAPRKEGDTRTWRIIGRDALDWSCYPLPGAYPNRKRAEQAARERLRFLEGFQPTATSGGQSGIQDRVYVVKPDGTTYRFTT